jgi:hypothetical protein
VSSPVQEILDWVIPLVVMIPLLGACVAELLAPNTFRIRFADRTYHQRTERDRFTLQWRGRTGSCDEFDCVRITEAHDDESDITWWTVHLVWKDPGKSAVRLRTLTSQAAAREWAGWLAGRLGLPLQGYELQDQPTP